MGEDKKFECSKCPIYEACALAHIIIFGGIPVTFHGISSYRECRYYRKCSKADDVEKCIMQEMSSKRKPNGEVARFFITLIPKER